MNILDFSKKASSLLEDTTDHNALRKLNSYLLEQLEKLSLYQSKHAELNIANDRMKLAQEVLEQELINYKLKFEEINKKMVEWEYPTAKGIPEANASFRTNPSNDEFPVEEHINQEKPSISFQEIAENLSHALNFALSHYVATNKKYIKSFEKEKSNIQQLTTELFKRNMNYIKDGKKIDNFDSSSTGLLFEHVLSENGPESILSFTKKAGKDKIIYNLVPQPVVEQILMLPDAKASKYYQFIIKNISEVVEFSKIKIGVRKYWLMPVVQEISKTKDEFLKILNID